MRGNTSGCEDMKRQKAALVWGTQRWRKDGKDGSAGSGCANRSVRCGPAVLHGIHCSTSGTGLVAPNGDGTSSMQTCKDPGQLLTRLEVPMHDVVLVQEGHALQVAGRQWKFTVRGGATAARGR